MGRPESFPVGLFYFGALGELVVNQVHQVGGQCEQMFALLDAVELTVDLLTLNLLELEIIVLLIEAVV